MKCVHATTLDNSLFLCMSNGKRCINKTGKNQKSARRERKFLAFTERKNIHYHEKKKGQTTDNTIDTVIKPLVNRIPLRVYTEVR